MKVIGVTGGIGSGKSSVSKILGELGAKVIDADSISKEITVKGSEALNEIIKHFGKVILNEAGELDRKRLGGIVFGNDLKLAELEKITHKYIVREIESRIQKEKIKNEVKIIVLEVTIPVHHGFMDLSDEIWVVIAEKDVRIARIIKRNAYTLEEVEKRMNSQLSDEEYCKLADRVIDNSGTIEELRSTIEDLLEIIIS